MEPLKVVELDKVNVVVEPNAFKLFHCIDVLGVFNVIEPFTSKVPVHVIVPDEYVKFPERKYKSPIVILPPIRVIGLVIVNPKPPFSNVLEDKVPPPILIYAEPLTL